MQLLVSVRSADEVGPALAGGADIIDAKEPDRGSLGAVDRDVLSRILQRVPDDCGVSVALGDVTRPEEVLAAVHGLELPQRTAPTYLKLGFAGVRSPDQVGLLIEIAVSATSGMAASPRIVAVAYADPERARTVPPALIPSLAKATGAAGVLLDTHGKDGRGLLEWVPFGALVDWVAVARQAGLLAALAGSLRPEDLALVWRAQPDVVGVRGAACSGGRQGRVSENRVRRFRLALEWAVRETRDTGAISSVPTVAKSRKLKA
ncbi:MAG TPA: (5-formylfuran-3-yl)methyl phosphate synthase [Gemmatimonadales bacterium]|nr:(5-formylfuran-3-yl)methyl phosphate synthase [Gemmatimonadales bacterium]